MIIMQTSRNVDPFVVYSRLNLMEKGMSFIPQGWIEKLLLQNAALHFNKGKIIAYESETDFTRHESLIVFGTTFIKPLFTYCSEIVKEAKKRDGFYIFPNTVKLWFFNVPMFYFFNRNMRYIKLTTGDGYFIFSLRPRVSTSVVIRIINKFFQTKIFFLDERFFMLYDYKLGKYNKKLLSKSLRMGDRYELRRQIDGLMVGDEKAIVHFVSKT